MKTQKKIQKKIQNKNQKKHYTKFPWTKFWVVFINLVALGIVFSMYVHAGDLFGNAQNLLDTVYSKFVGLSTGAASVGVGTGSFMKKFSRGKEQQVEMGNKVIKDSVIAWATLNGIGLGLNFLSPFLK